MNNIRPMNESDLAAINEIYNQAVAMKFSTAHTDPISIDERLEWFAEHKPDSYPVFVWHERDQVIGWLELLLEQVNRLCRQ